LPRLSPESVLVSTGYHVFDPIHPYDSRTSGGLLLGGRIAGFEQVAGAMFAADKVLGC